MLLTGRSSEIGLILLISQVARGSAGLGFISLAVHPVRRIVWNLVLVIWNLFISCTLGLLQASGQDILDQIPVDVG